MADETDNANTHFSDLEGRFDRQTTAPQEPVAGDFYFNSDDNKLYIYNGTNWRSAAFSTTTSTSSSTSTTSTSTSTTSTSSSTSSSTSITTSTSTSTTTTF